MKWSDSFVTLPSGDRVRYSFFRRDDSEYHYVRFKDVDGKYAKRCTNEAVKHRAIGEAHRIVLEAYRVIAPTSDTITWDHAKETLSKEMTADGKRPRTIGGYLETLDKLISMFPLAKGPADVTARMAGDFKVRYGSAGKTSRKKGEGGVEGEARAAKSLDSRVRTLKAVFSWFARLKIVDENPFEGVEQPTMDRPVVKYVTRANIGSFFAWLEQRYPGWAMPRLFFSVKALSGCRLRDVCSLRSKQLREGRLVFEADLTKNRSERYVVLPEDVFAALDAYKGDRWLWERYPAELKAANARNGAPSHQ
jgi:integrase